ncbi:hypothetical protein [Archaeoglobus sp.]
MTCYGWIPTLAGEEIFDLLCEEFILSSEKLPENLRDVVKDFIRDKLNWSVDVSKVLVISNNLFDLKKSNNLTFLQFNANWRIERIAIVEGDFKKLVRGEVTIIANAEIVFHDGGLIGIILTSFNRDYEKQNVDQRKVERQIFRIIRDVYHVHTHHKHQDVLLEPVCANDSNEAKDKLLKQYLKKIVDYHKEVKARVDLGFWHYFSIFKYKDAEDTILQAIGEIIYGESFSEIFHRNHISRFRRAKDSLQTLHNRIKAKYYLIPIIFALPSATLLTVIYAVLPLIWKYYNTTVDLIHLILLVFALLIFPPLFIIIFTLLSYAFRFGIVPSVKNWWNKVVKKLSKWKRYETGIFNLKSED